MCDLKQLLNLGFGFGIGTFAEVLVDDPTALVDQVEGRPVAIAEGVPSSVVIVLGDRIGDAESAYRLIEIGRYLFMCILGRVHTNDDQPLIAIAFVPLLHMGQGALAVDAVIGPELDENDLSAQLFQGQGLAVDPVGDPTWDARCIIAPSDRNPANWRGFLMLARESAG